MTETIGGSYEAEVRRLDGHLPRGPRVVVLGSTDFWHHDSEATCTAIGRLMAGIPGLVLLTGGVEGIGEAIGRSFFRARCEAGLAPQVFHILPRGEDAWDYAETLFAGADMTERREILGRLSGLFIVVEGGPGVKHEVEVARGRGALIVPVGRSGGYAATIYFEEVRDPAVDPASWAVLGSNASTAEETAKAVVRVVQTCLSSTAAVIDRGTERDDQGDDPDQPLSGAEAQESGGPPPDPTRYPDRHL